MIRITEHCNRKGTTIFPKRKYSGPQFDEKYCGQAEDIPIIVLNFEEEKNDSSRLKFKKKRFVLCAIKTKSKSDKKQKKNIPPLKLNSCSVTGICFSTILKYLLLFGEIIADYRGIHIWPMHAQ